MLSIYRNFVEGKVRHRDIVDDRFLYSNLNENNDIEVESNLMDILMPSKKCDVTQLSPTSLAYIGDAVFELFARSRYAWPSRRTTTYREKVIDSVRGMM